MNARKPVDPRDEVQVSDVLRDRPSDSAGRPPAEEPLSPDPRDAHVEAEGDDEDVGLHANVEVESGPVDREDRDDPLPEAP